LSSPPEGGRGEGEGAWQTALCSITFDKPNSGALPVPRFIPRNLGVPFLFIVKREKVRLSNKKTEAGNLLCFWVVRESGTRQTKLARVLRISQPAVSMAVARGEELAGGHNFPMDK